MISNSWQNKFFMPSYNLTWHFLTSFKCTSSFQLLTLSTFFQARPLLKERNYPDLIDERMMDNHDCHQLFWMIRLAEKCLSRDSQRRLSMDTVSLNWVSLRVCCYWTLYWHFEYS